MDRRIVLVFDDSHEVHSISLICDKSFTTQNLAFSVISIERNICTCNFNRYSVVTQFVELAAGEQLCRPCTRRKL